MKRESNIQAQIQLALALHRVAMFRNNIGAYQTPEGHRVTYGVGGPGGSDLIGITPVTVTADMVGQTLGVFTAIEVKSHKGRATERQAAFIASIKRLGGFAGVAKSPADALDIIGVPHD